MRRRFLFLGKDTAGSLAVRSFPSWMGVFGVDCELSGVDLPADAPDGDYLDLLDRVRRLDGCAGMQVTSHKVRLYQAARGGFDRCSHDAELLEEVGGVIVSDGGLVAVSPDAAAFRAELAALIGPRPPMNVVLLGGGGASRAIALVASSFPNVRRIAVTEIDPDRARDLLRWVDGLRDRGVRARIEVLPARDNDALVSAAGEGALVVNASGMGKDTEGSPVGPAAEFPRGAIAWDLNYRGELSFLRHARDQARRRDLSVLDGFSLFITNWTWLLESALGRKLSDAAREDLWRTTQSIRNR